VYRHKWRTYVQKSVFIATPSMHAFNRGKNDKAQFYKQKIKINQERGGKMGMAGSRKTSSQP
jgi:hypothetical protein